MRCSGRTPGLEFCCRIVSREEGYCVSLFPLGVERVVCMTAEYLETPSRNMPNEFVFGSSSNSVPIWYLRRYSFAISKIVEESLCCIKVGWFKVGGPCKLGELEVYSLIYKLLAR